MNDKTRFLDKKGEVVTIYKNLKTTKLKKTATLIAFFLCLQTSEAEVEIWKNIVAHSSSSLGSFTHLKYPTYFNNNGPYTHFGIDILADCGAEIRVMAGGVVDEVSFSGKSEYNWAGNGVIINHGSIGKDSRDVYTMYLHMRDKPKVDKGNMVVAGQLIGYIGETGSANGCHTHYEIRYFKGESGWFHKNTKAKNGNLNIYHYGDAQNLDWAENDWEDPAVTFLPAGYYSDGFHNDLTSQAFIDTYKDHLPSIGWPVDNGGTVYVHEWSWEGDRSYSVICQDFLGTIGYSGKSMLILNDINIPGYSKNPKAYLLSGGFYDFYKGDVGPYKYGVPITPEEIYSYSDGPYNLDTDPINKGDKVTIQKFRRRLASSPNYTEERRTLIWKEGIEARHFPVGVLSLGGDNDIPDGIQLYAHTDSDINNGIAWPMKDSLTPTNKWIIKPGVYHFYQYEPIKKFLRVVTIQEGNYQFTNISKPDSGSDPDIDPEPTLNPPTSFKAASIDGVIRLSWDRNAEFPEARYQLFRDTNDDFSFSTMIGQFYNSYTTHNDNSVLVGKTYYYRIRCEYSGLTSEYSSVKSATATGFPGPKNFKLDSVTTSNVYLSWDSVPGAYSYFVMRSYQGTQEWAKSVNATSYTDSNVISGRYYRYVLRAKKETLSDLSDSVMVQVPKNQPDSNLLTGSITICKNTQTGTDGRTIPINTVFEVKSPADSIHFLLQAYNISGRYQLGYKVFRNGSWNWPDSNLMYGTIVEKTGQITEYDQMDIIHDTAKVYTQWGETSPVTIKVEFYVKLLDQENKEVFLDSASYKIIDDTAMPDTGEFSGSVTICRKTENSNGKVAPKDTVLEVQSPADSIHFLCQAQYIPGRYQLGYKVFRNEKWNWPKAEEMYGSTNGGTGKLTVYTHMDIIHKEAKIYAEWGEVSPITIRVKFYVKLLDQENREVLMGEASYQIIDETVSIQNNFKINEIDDKIELYNIDGRKIKKTHPKKGDIIKIDKEKSKGISIK